MKNKEKKIHIGISRKHYIGELLVFSIALFTRISFWWYTKWTIEDAMIIARMVKNLVDFGQFSFNLGERVSTSTSPLFGLLSAVISYTGIPPISSAKILGSIASSLTAVLIFRILYRVNENNENELYKFSAAIAGSMIYTLLPPVIAYSVSGLETAVYALVCAISLDQLSKRRNPQAQSLAVLFAVLSFLFRPDGAILLVVVSFVILWDERRNYKKTLKKFWPLFVLIPIGLVLHQLYFGTPVPQSLIAKANGYVINIPQNAKRYISQMLFAQPGSILFYVLAIIGAIWISRKSNGLLVFVFWYILYHLIFILRAPLFDWYLQVPLFVLCLFSAFGIHGFIEILANVFHLNMKIFILKPIFGFSIGIILIYAMTIYIEGKRDNYLYEMAVRGAAGQWLTRNTSVNALVFTESLGYIGYYAHNSFVDWPGLASPTVPELLVKKRVTTSRERSYEVIIYSFNPEYLVLRENEWLDMSTNLGKSYEVCEFFQPSSELSGTSYLIAGKTCP